MDLTDDNIKDMSFQETCDTLKKLLALVARNFQYKVEVFFKMIVLNNLLVKIKYYAIHVEFQVTGSSYIHSFIWIFNAAKLTKESKE